jgi:hypothetical protein
MTIANGISGFFEPQTRAFLGAHVQLGADNAGYYSTAPLRATLEELVNFNLLGKAKVRLTVGAANLRTSVMPYFDCRDMTLTVDHIMASGALPPAFPAVHRRRALLGRRHPLQHAGRAHLRGQTAPQQLDLCRASVEPDGAGAHDDLGEAAPPQGDSVFKPNRQPHVAAFGFLLAVLWLDVVWVHSVSDQHDIAAMLGRRGWLNAFVTFGAFGAAVLLLVWVNSCTHGAF